VDGFGIVLRGFKDVTVNGLAFSTMADSTAGGRQIDGFHGISVEYMRSKKFLCADGGYDLVVWIPQETKERLKTFIPDSVYDKIATEGDVRSISELKEFLTSHNHPVIQRWVTGETIPETTPAEAALFHAGDLPVNAGGFWIIFKNARITAERVIIQPVKPGSHKGGERSDPKKS
jgi:acetyl-CoA decarbonylase/synthase complex subunit beta